MLRNLNLKHYGPSRIMAQDPRQFTTKFTSALSVRQLRACTSVTASLSPDDHEPPRVRPTARRSERPQALGA